MGALLWRTLVLALMVLAGTRVLAQTASYISSTRTDTLVPVNTKFPITVSFVGKSACTTSKITRVEGVFPLMVMDSFDLAGPNCNNVLDATGLITSPNCALGNTARQATFNVAFSHVPASGSTKAVKLYFEDSTCDSTFNIANMALPDFFPGAKIVMDPETPNAALVTFFTYFSMKTTDTARISILVPQILTPLGSPAVNYAWVFPTQSSPTLSQWHSSIPLVDATDPIKINFMFRPSSQIVSCNPCVVRITNVRPRPQPTPYLYHPGSISVISASQEVVAAELALMLDPDTIPTPEAIDCVAGTRLMTPVTVTLATSTQRQWTALRLDVPEPMRVPLAATGHDMSVAPVLGGTYAADSTRSTFTLTGGPARSGTVTLTLTRLMYCPYDVIPYELTVSLLDDVGATVAAGTIPVVTRLAQLPVTLMATNPAQYTYENIVSSGLLAFSVTIDFTAFYHPDRRYILAVVVPDYGNAILFPPGQLTTLSGLTLISATPAADMGSRIYEFNSMTANNLASCFAPAANTATSCVQSFAFAFTMTKQLVSLNPFDLQFQLLRSGQNSDAMRRAWASGTATMPAFRPFSLPAAVPTRAKMTLTSGKWVSEAIKLPYVIPGTGAVASAQGLAIRVSYSAGMSSCTTQSSDPVVQMNARSDITVTVSCPGTLAPDLFNLYAFVSLDAKNVQTQEMVFFASWPPISFALQPTSSSASTTVVMQFTNTITTTTATAAPGFDTYSGRRKIRATLPSRGDISKTGLGIILVDRGWNACQGPTVVTDAPLQQIEMILATCTTQGYPITVGLERFAMAPGHYQPQDDGALLFEFMVEVSPDAWATVHRATLNVAVTASAPSTLAISVTPNTQTPGPMVPSLVVDIRHSASSPTSFLETVMNANQGMIVTLPPVYTQYSMPVVTFNGAPCTITRYGVTSRGPNSRYFEFAPFGGPDNSVMRFQWTNVQTSSTSNASLANEISFSVVDKSNPAVAWRSLVGTAPAIRLPGVTETQSELTYIHVPCPTSATGVKCFNMRGTFPLAVSLALRDTPFFEMLLPFRPATASLFASTTVTVSFGGVVVPLTRSTLAGFETYYSVTVTAAMGLTFVPAGTELAVEVQAYPIPLFHHVKFTTSATDFVESMELHLTVKDAGETLLHRAVFGLPPVATTTWPLVDYDAVLTKNVATLSLTAAPAPTLGQAKLTLTFQNDAPQPPSVPPSIFDMFFVQHAYIYSIVITPPRQLVFRGTPIVTLAGGGSFDSVTVTTNGTLILQSNYGMPVTTAVLSLTIESVYVLSSERLDFVGGSFPVAESTAWLPDMRFNVEVVRYFSKSNILVPLLPYIPDATQPTGASLSSPSAIFRLPLTVNECSVQLDAPTWLFGGDVTAIVGAQQTSTTPVAATLTQPQVPYTQNMARYTLSLGAAQCTGAVTFDFMKRTLSRRLYGRLPVVVHSDWLTDNKVYPPGPLAMVFFGPSPFNPSPDVVVQGTRLAPAATGVVRATLVTPCGAYLIAVIGTRAIRYTRDQQNSLADSTGSLAAPVSADFGLNVVAAAVSPDSRYFVAALEGSMVLRVYAVASWAQVGTIDVDRITTTKHARVQAASVTDVVAGVMSLRFSHFAAAPKNQYLLVVTRSGRTLRFLFNWQTGSVNGSPVSIGNPAAPTSQLVHTRSFIVALSRTSIISTVSETGILATATRTLPVPITRVPTAFGSTAVDRIVALPHDAESRTADLLIATSAMGDVWVLQVTAGSYAVAAHHRVATNEPFRALVVTPAASSQQQLYVTIAGASRQMWVLTFTPGTSIALEEHPSGTSKLMSAVLPTLFNGLDSTVEIVGLTYALDSANLYITLNNGNILTCRTGVTYSAELASNPNVMAQGGASLAIAARPVVPGVVVTFTYYVPIASRLASSTSLRLQLPRGAKTSAADPLTVSVANGATFVNVAGATSVSGELTTVAQFSSAGPIITFTVTTEPAVQFSLMRLTFGVVFSDVATYPLDALGLGAPSSGRQRADSTLTLQVVSPSSGLLHSYLGGWALSPVLRAVPNVPDVVFVSIETTSNLAGTATQVTLTFELITGRLSQFNFALPAYFETTATPPTALTLNAAFITVQSSSSPAPQGFVNRASASSPITYRVDVTTLHVGTIRVVLASLRNPTTPQPAVDISVPITGRGSDHFTPVTAYLPAVVVDATPAWGALTSVPVTLAAQETMTALLVTKDGANAYVGTSAGRVIVLSLNTVTSVWEQLEAQTLFSAPITHLTSVYNSKLIAAYADSISSAYVLRRLSDFRGRLYFNAAALVDLSEARASACVLSRIYGGCDVVNIGPIRCVGFGLVESPWSAVPQCYSFALYLRSGLGIRFDRTGPIAAETAVGLRSEFMATIPSPFAAAKRANMFEWTYRNDGTLTVRGTMPYYSVLNITVVLKPGPTTGLYLPSNIRAFAQTAYPLTALLTCVDGASSVSALTGLYNWALLGDGRVAIMSADASAGVLAVSNPIPDYYMDRALSFDALPSGRGVIVGMASGALHRFGLTCLNSLPAISYVPALGSSAALPAQPVLAAQFDASGRSLFLLQSSAIYTTSLIRSLGLVAIENIRADPLGPGALKRDGVLTLQYESSSAAVVQKAVADAGAGGCTIQITFDVNGAQLKYPPATGAINFTAQDPDLPIELVLAQSSYTRRSICTLDAQGVVLSCPYLEAAPSAKIENLALPNYMIVNLRANAALKCGATIAAESAAVSVLGTEGIVNLVHPKAGEFTSLIGSVQHMHVVFAPAMHHSVPGGLPFVPYTATLSDTRRTTACDASQYDAATGLPLMASPGCCAFSTTPSGKFASTINVAVPTEDSNGTADVWVMCSMSTTNAIVTIAPAASNVYAAHADYLSTDITFAVTANLIVEWGTTFDSAGRPKVIAGDLAPITVRHSSADFTASSAIDMYFTGDESCELCDASGESCQALPMAASIASAQSSVQLTLLCVHTGDKLPLMIAPLTPSTIQFPGVVVELAKVTSALIVTPFPDNELGLIPAQQATPFSLKFKVPTYRPSAAFYATPSATMQSGNHFCEVRAGGVALPWSSDLTRQEYTAEIAVEEVVLTIFCNNMVSSQDKLVIAFSDPLGEYTSASTSAVVTDGFVELMRGDVVIANADSPANADFLLIATNVEAFRFKVTPPPSRGTMFKATVVDPRPTSGQCTISSTAVINQPPFVNKVDFVAYDTDPISDPFYVTCQGATGPDALQVRIERSVGDFYTQVFTLRFSATGEIRITRLTVPEIVEKTHLIYAAGEDYVPAVTDSTATRFPGSAVTPLRIEVVPPPPVADGNIQVALTLELVHNCYIQDAVTPGNKLTSTSLTFSNTVSSHTIRLECPGVARDKSKTGLFSVMRIVDASFSYPTAMVAFVLEGTVELTLLDGSSVPDTLAVNTPLHARLSSTIQENVLVKIAVTDSGAKTCKISPVRDDATQYTVGPLQFEYFPDTDQGRAVYVLCSNPTADTSTQIRVTNADTRKYVINDWSMVDVKATGTVYLTPSGESHTAPLPTTVRQDLRQDLWLYVDPKAPNDFRFEVNLVNPGNDPDLWPDCALYAPNSAVGAQTITVSVGLNDVWSPSFGYKCTSTAALGPSIVIIPAETGVGYSEFYGSAMSPRGYGTFFDTYGDALRDTIPLETPYVVQVDLYPKNVAALLYDFTLSFSSAAGQCRMWRYEAAADLIITSDSPTTKTLNVVDAKDTIKIVVYCTASAVTGPQLIFAPTNSNVWFTQQQSGVMAINGLVSFIQISSNGDPLVAQVFRPNVNRNVQTLFSLSVQPAMPQDTMFRVEIDSASNAGLCALRLYDIGTAMEPSGLETMFANSVDLPISRGVNSPSASNLPSGVPRRALILRCTRLPGTATMPYLRVSVVTAAPVLMYATARSTTPIVVAGGISVVETGSTVFPTSINAGVEVAMTMTLSPAPSTASTLLISPAKTNATSGSCLVSFAGGAYAASVQVTFAEAATTKLFSMRCSRVSNPVVNTLIVSYVSGETYAKFTSPEFVVNSLGRLMYLEPDVTSPTFVQLPTASGSVPRTIITTHTATRMRLVLPVPPADTNTVSFKVTLDSGSVMQGIKGFFLPKATVESAVTPDTPFLTGTPPDSIELTFTGADTQKEFYFYTNTPHQTGTNVIPFMSVTRTSGVAYLNVDGPRMRLRASVCLMLGNLDDATIVSYANSQYYNASWYPDAWRDVYYSHLTLASFSCKPGYYLADAGKRADPSANVVTTTMRCDAKVWTGPTLSCEPVTCPEFTRDTASTTGVVVTPNSRGHQTRFGANIRVNCIEGNVVGQAVPVSAESPLFFYESVTCRLAPDASSSATTGLWLRSDGQSALPCVPVDCGAIEHNTVDVDGTVMHVENGIPSGQTKLGGIVSFTCSPGYELEGDDRTAQCMPTGYWSWTTGAAPVCNSLDCIAFTASENMETIVYDRAPAAVGGEFGEVYLESTVASFKCKDGYRIGGSAGSQTTTAVCTSERGWSIESPRCEVLQCVKTAVPSAGSSFTYSPPSAAASQRVPHLTTATVVCPVGYDAWGNHERTVPAQPRRCIDTGGTSGSWDGPETLCLIHVCDNLAPGNGTIVYANNGDNEERSYLSEAHFACQAGFDVTPRSGAVRTCREVGVGWVPAVDPACIALTCPAMRAGPNVASINYSAGSYGTRRLGSVASVTCDADYVVQDQPLALECGSDGQWVDPDTRAVMPTPTCTRRNCKYLTEKRHGKVTYVDRGYGATYMNSLALVTCDAGFYVEPTRSATLICTNDRWEAYSGTHVIPSTGTYDPVPPCVDIDECATVNCGNMYGPGSECINTVGGYTCTPYIANYTMTIGGDDKQPLPVTYPLTGAINETVRSVNLVDTSGLDRLTFRVFTGESVAVWASSPQARFTASRVRGIRYERLVAPQVKFDCTLTDVGAVLNLPTFQRVSCSTSAGGGLNLPMSIYFCATRRFTSALPSWDADETAVEEEGVSCMWTRVVDPTDPTKWPNHVYHVNYPAPTSTPSTLRSATFNDRTGSPNLVGRTTLGQKETVILTGTNFFANPTALGVMTVVFGPLAVLQGPDALTNGFKCTIDANDAARSTVTSVYCEMDFESGLDLHFLIDVLGQRVITSDTFSFPITLRVFNIVGCETPRDPTLNTTTVGCPTSGNVNMTVYGDGFLEPTAVYVNGDECILTSRTNDYVHCTLPPGTGVSLSVIVTSGSQYFEVPAMLSYAAPRITRISGQDCLNVDEINLINCPRTGTTTLTLEGSNFGAQGATIYIGGVSCSNVVHSPNAATANSLVTCTLPQGSRTQRSVVVFQRYGELSTEQAYVSYTQCSPGTQDINFECVPCRAGTYTDTEGQSECKECSPGAYNSADGMSACSACRSGTYSPVGSSVCTDCPKGSFSTGNAGSCTTCSVGTYSPNTGANTCLPCPYGGTSDADYAGCHCLSGFFLNQVKECETCMLGGDCVKTGTTFFNVVPLSGYYPTAMATDKDAPRVLRFTIDVVSSYNISLAYEHQSLLALIMRSTYDGTGIARDRLQVLSVVAVTLSSKVSFDLDGFTSAVSANGAASMGDSFQLTQTAEQDGDDDGTVDSGDTLVPGVRFSLDVYPPVTVGGESADTVFKRFLNLMRPPTVAATISSELGVHTLADSAAPTLMYTSFGGANLKNIKVDSGYQRSAFVNFEPCLSSSCVGGLQMCAEGYEGPLCTVCSTGYSKKTTYLCESCGTLTDRVGRIMLSLFILVAVSGVLVFFSVRDTSKNLDLPRIIRSVSHVAFFKIIVCAVQVWAIGAQFDFEWPGVLSSYMQVMDVAGNIGIDAISLDCFSTNAEAYGMSNSNVRPLFLTTIGAFVLPIFALLFPLIVLIPAYLVHRRRYTRDLAAVAYVAKLDLAADQASLQASAAAARAAAEEAAEASRMNAQVDAKSSAAQDAVERKRKELYSRGLAARTAMVKTTGSMIKSADSFDQTTANTAAALSNAAKGGVRTSRIGSTSGPGVEMQPLGRSGSQRGPLAPPAPPLDGDDESEEADELFNEFNIDMGSNQNSTSDSMSRYSISANSAEGFAASPAPAAAAVQRPAFSPAPASTSRGASFRTANSSSSLGVSMIMGNSSSAAAGQVEFHVDDFVDDGPAESSSMNGFVGAGSGSFSSRRNLVGLSARRNAHTAEMSAIQEETSIRSHSEEETGSGNAAVEPAGGASAGPASGSRRPSLSGSESSRASMASSAVSGASSRRSRAPRNKSFRESLIGPRLTSRGMLRRDVVLHGTTDANLERDRALDAAGLTGGDREHEPSRSMSRSQLARESMKRTSNSTALMDAVAAQQGTEYVQLQRDRRVFRFTIDQLAELLQTYQYIYICCIATALYLLHPNISRAFFRLVACKTVGGGSSAALDVSVTNDDGLTIHYSAADFDLPHSSSRFVLADMSLVCYSGEHFAWMFTLGLALFVFWIIGVPLGFFLYLRRNSSLLRAQPNQLPVADLRQRHRVEYGFAFLFLGFQPKWYYWFIAEMARKVLYVAVSIFFPGQLHVQLLMASFVAFAAISAQTAVRPFEQPVLEHFEFASLLVTFILFFLANFYMIENEISKSSKDAITAAVFTSFMLFYVVAAIVLLLLLKQNRRTEQIRSSVTVALRRNIDPALLLQTWRREERKRRETKHGKGALDDNMRNIFVESAEQDARNELDQYLDGGESTSDSMANSRESSVVHTGSASSSVKREPSPSPTASSTVAAGVSTLASAGADTTDAAFPAADTAAHDKSSPEHSLSAQSLSLSTSAMGVTSTSGSGPVSASAAHALSSSMALSSSAAPAAQGASASAAPSRTPTEMSTTATAMSQQSVAPSSSETASSTKTASAKVVKDKKKPLKKKPFASKVSEARASESVFAAPADHGDDDAALTADLDKAIAAAAVATAAEESGSDDDGKPPATTHDVDFLAQSIAQTNKDVSERLKQRAVANKFGAVDVAEGKAPFSGVPVHGAAAPHVPQVVDENLFYQAADEDEDELEDNEVWAQNVTSGQNGYF